MGLHVSAWGRALDDGFLELTHAVVGADDSARRVALSAGRSKEGVLVDFAVADWVLGAAFGRKDGEVSVEEIRTIAASMVHVQLHGTVVRAGRTELHLAVCPVGDEESDAICVALDLSSPST